MASNFNNYSDIKPNIQNSSLQQTNMNINPNFHNRSQPMSGNINAPWRSPIHQTWQSTTPQPMQNNMRPRNIIPQMVSAPGGLNQQWQGNSSTNTVAPQAMPYSPKMNVSTENPSRWTQPSSSGMIPQNLNSMMTAPSGSPSRTAPPSWPSASPRATSTFVIQPPTINNAAHTVEQQVYAEL